MPRGLRLTLGAWIAAVGLAVALGTAIEWHWRVVAIMSLVPGAVRLAGVGAGKGSLVRLQWAGNGSWYGWDAAGRLRMLRLVAPSSILGRVVVLVLAEGRRRHWIAVTPAAVGERAFRSLKVRLDLDRHRGTDPCW